ncbi:hypothetical protein [Oryza sativa Japonica Group]|uniref:Os01g0807201 protein n=1 Tax=Oryza sativa subsp. japonica TaxID=39947 RepID=Q5VR56_ORYSJ|nr:hypothetical protein [Oryza sativa Japonica Group]BAH91341.1 Os01g0807201 [Oryza sativa Japonica Group]|eukprot:NP_001172611.1 Os01g0807201 [Oryza sativa Japonica Group]
MARDTKELDALGSCARAKECFYAPIGFDRVRWHHAAREEPEDCLERIASHVSRSLVGGYWLAIQGSKRRAPA